FLPCLTFARRLFGQRLGVPSLRVLAASAPGKGQFRTTLFRKQHEIEEKAYKSGNKKHGFLW
ncbi:hypothetical protein, partial [uncultured Halomonas sp.]|uniref:hypothetical protein n=1 Tax=uncultured Halomonas sp. TaxID=173971 RepID=UPI002595251B